MKFGGSSTRSTIYYIIISTKDKEEGSWGGGFLRTETLVSCRSLLLAVNTRTENSFIDEYQATTKELFIATPEMRFGTPSNPRVFVDRAHNELLCFGLAWLVQIVWSSFGIVTNGAIDCKLYLLCIVCVYSYFFFNQNGSNFRSKHHLNWEDDKWKKYSKIKIHILSHHFLLNLSHILQTGCKSWYLKKKDRLKFLDLFNGLFNFCYQVQQKMKY